MIYLDNAATTAVSQKAAEACMFAMRSCYGNPSSLYHFGIEAEKLLDFSRETISGALNAKPEEIFFTSGATESNNTAVMGLASVYGKRKRRAVVTGIEHPSCLEAFMRLKEEGFEVAVIMPNKAGLITEDMLFDSVDENTCLLSAMLVNNETGHVLPIDRAFPRIKKAYPGCMLHSDCVQGFMKLDISVKTLGADVISISGHKVHAPKGVGAMWIKKGVRVRPLLVGGGQQGGIRSGTEAVPMIYSFAKSVEELRLNISERYDRATSLKRLAEGLLRDSGCEILSPECGSPYILSVHVPGIKSETVLHFLESKGIMVSSGSACSKGKKSRVLTAFGFSDKVADSVIRISTSHDTSEEDIKALADGVSEAMRSLVKIKR